MRKMGKESGKKVEKCEKTLERAGGVLNQSQVFDLYAQSDGFMCDLPQIASRYKGVVGESTY